MAKMDVIIWRGNSVVDGAARKYQLEKVRDMNIEMANWQ